MFTFKVFISFTPTETQVIPFYQRPILLAENEIHIYGVVLLNCVGKTYLPDLGTTDLPMGQCWEMNADLTGERVER